MTEPERTVDRAETWAVVRQDDHGNRFVVKTGLSHQQAEEIAREFEARGHKQMYSVEPDQRNSLP
jgi:hypothetical protein